MGVQASEIRAEAKLLAAGLPVLFATCLAVWLLFRPTAPAHAADLWFAAVVVQSGLLLALLIRFRARPPSDAALLQDWQWPARRLRLPLMLTVAAAPWLLMAGADPVIQMLGLASILWFLGLHMLAVSTAAPMPVPAVAAVAGSAALFALVEPVPHAPAWALLLLAAAASFVALKGQVRRSVVEAVAARLAVERAAAETRQALAVAAAERDAKARFIASASHDLQQPLAAGRLWFRLAIDSQGGDDRARAVARADQAFGAAADLVGAMLDHLRLEAGAVAARLQPVPLGPLLASLAEDHAPAAQAAGIRIRPLPTGRAVMADPGLLRRALGNLLVNALRHSGGRRVLIGVRPAGAQVAIWVLDDGRGVAPADQGRLFDDYVQGHAVGPGGFGIGLASVRRHAALMGGAARLEPRWRGGAAFCLTLPAAGAAA